MPSNMSKLFVPSKPNPFRPLHQIEQPRYHVKEVNLDKKCNTDVPPLPKALSKRIADAEKGVVVVEEQFANASDMGPLSHKEKIIAQG